MAEDSKTEKASPKKKRDERKKGNIFFSKDIVALAGLLAGFYGLKFLMPSIYNSIVTYIKLSIARVKDINELSIGDSAALINEGIITAMKSALPIAVLVGFFSIIATGVQTKFIFTGKNMAPQFNRLSPLKGIKNLLSLKNLIELLKGVLKVIILLVIVYLLIKGQMNAVARTMGADILASCLYMLNIIMKMIFQVALAFAAISAFDYLYQWWDYERKIKMSKQEVKEEYKQTEGNPEIKGKIREMQRQRAKARMMQAVPEADVIIRNPTHFAVALKYEIDTYNAPVVIAKGQDELALRIIRVGEENGVPVVEDKPLARAIYATAKVGQEIAEDYYGAVAEILVYIYKMDHRI